MQHHIYLRTSLCDGIRTVHNHPWFLLTTTKPPWW